MHEVDMTAHNQWGRRTKDETFSSFSTLIDYGRQKREKARQTTLGFDAFDVELHNDQVVLTKGSKKIGLSNWAFIQLCSRLGQKPAAIMDLPADLVVPILQYRLDMLVEREDARESKVLFSQEKDGLIVRAFNGSQYTRVWDYQVAEKLASLQTKGWDVPASYKSGEFGGDVTKCAGLYCGDRDMFCFLVNEKYRVNDGTDKGLAPGFYIGNSEVGAQGYNITSFWHRFVCGNHMVWGIQDIEKVRIRHVGEADQKAMDALTSQLDKYADTSRQFIEKGIKKAKAFEIADSEDGVVEEIFNRRHILPKRTIQAALAEATIFEEIDGNPWSAWGLAQGVSRVSQREDYASVRVGLDNATEKILALAN